MLVDVNVSEPSKQSGLPKSLHGFSSDKCPLIGFYRHPGRLLCFCRREGAPCLLRMVAKPSSPLVFCEGATAARHGLRSVAPGLRTSHHHSPPQSLTATMPRQCMMDTGCWDPNITHNDHTDKPQQFHGQYSSLKSSSGWRERCFKTMVELPPHSHSARWPRTNHPIHTSMHSVCVLLTAPAPLSHAPHLSSFSHEVQRPQGSPVRGVHAVVEGCSLSGAMRGNVC